MRKLNWIDTGKDYVAVDDRGHVLALIRPIGGLSDTRPLKRLTNDSRASREVNPKVDQRIKERLDYRKRRRRELKPSR